jgi:hypothetical protein
MLHLAIIVGGAEWYRFFGAGGRMARAAERGHAMPAVYAVLIALLLFVWAAYAFSGAGLLRRLPLLRTGLVTISAVYLLRGLAPVPVLFMKPELLDSFAIWSSLIVLVYGIAYAMGTWKAWPMLRPPAAAA